MHLPSSLLPGILGLLLTLSSLVHSQCSSTCVRKEVRSLSDQELSSFLGAINTLKSNGGYNKYVTIHLDYNTQAHGVPAFLPWHRAFILAFENEIKAIDSSVCAHYWAWELDSQAPEESPIFTAKYFGGNGNPASNMCISDGPFAQWRAHDGTCLTRDFSQGSRIGAWMAPSGLNQIMSSATSYDNFRQRFEGTAHAQVHNGIGGKRGWMSTMGSPNDPLFMVHHSNCDRIWANFQASRPEYANDYSGKDRTGRTVAKTDQLNPFPQTVQEVFSISDLCYSYSDMAPGQVNPRAPTEVPAPTGNPILLPRAVIPGVGGNISSGNSASPINATKPPKKTEVLPSDKHVTVGPSSTSNLTFSFIDRSDLSHIRYTEPVPESWCRMNNISVSTVRDYEATYRSVVDRLNNLVGYIDPSALYNRYDLWAQLLRSVKSFFVDYPGYGRISFNATHPDAYTSIGEIRSKVAFYLPSLQKPAESYENEITTIMGKPMFAKNSASNPRNVVSASSAGTSGSGSPSSSSSSSDASSMGHDPSFLSWTCVGILAALILH